MGTVRRLWTVAVVAVVAFATGCGSQNARSAVSSLMNTEITFPENLRCKVLSRDTVATEWLSVPYKLVVYMNSTQCDGCRLKDLLVWKHYISRVDSLNGADSLRFVFVFHPKDTAVLVEKLQLYDFELPVWLDRDGDFEQMNPLPEDPAFHTFLLGPNDRIMLVGSPVGRPKMWKLYEEAVAGIASGVPCRTETGL